MASLMDIFDQKNKKIFDQNNKDIYVEKDKNIFDEGTNSLLSLTTSRQKLHKLFFC